mmetsp:Transcript_43107/g.90222  ORF Transcript_43107/g.90222 Transcript_43107/m.90222 type:complete len:100 (+) Transcript_43107:99-398(+)
MSKRQLCAQGLHRSVHSSFYAHSYVLLCTQSTLKCTRAHESTRMIADDTDICVKCPTENAQVLSSEGQQPGLRSVAARSSAYASASSGRKQPLLQGQPA